MKPILNLHNKIEGELKFSNGQTLDYSLTDYDYEKPHRIAGSINVNDEDLGAKDIEEDLAILTVISYIYSLIPDAYLEIIQEFHQEYIFYLTEEQLTLLLNR